MADRIAAYIRRLREGDEAWKLAAARELRSLAYRNDANKVLIAEAGGIPPLVQLVRDGSWDAKQKATRALGNLACENAANKVAIAEAGGIAPLVAFLRDGCADTKLWTAEALDYLARNNDANAVAIAAAVSSDALVELARHGRVTFKRYYYMPVRNAGLPAKRKAALVVAQLIEATAPRTRVPAVLKAAIGSYL